MILKECELTFDDMTMLGFISKANVIQFSESESEKFKSELYNLESSGLITKISGGGYYQACSIGTQIFENFLKGQTNFLIELK